MARDKQYLYFYVACTEPITPQTDEAWMRLFINTDQNQSTGWEGYDYMINRVSPQPRKATLEQSKNGWQWQPASKADFRVNGREMEVRIARKLLGLTNNQIDIEFKWADHMQNKGEITDF